MNIEFSKLIFWLVYLPCLGATIYACVFSWKTNDSSALVVLLPLLFAELATATGFYYWKAKNENRIKLLKKHRLEIDKDDIER